MVLDMKFLHLFTIPFPPHNFHWQMVKCEEHIPTVFAAYYIYIHTLLTDIQTTAEVVSANCV